MNKRWAELGIRKPQLDEIVVGLLASSDPIGDLLLDWQMADDSQMSEYSESVVEYCW
jgi:hypothetical protein